MSAVAASRGSTRSGGLNRSLPFIIGSLVLALYAGTFVCRMHRDGSALPFAVIGTANTPGNRGYDGQYYYRIATRPLGSRQGIDNPAYRYQRIFYPMVARAIALGHQDAVAAMLVVVNVIAIAVGTLAIALLLRGNGISPAFALVWAVYAGQVAAFWRDLAEPLAMALAAFALLMVRRDRVVGAGLLLAVAALTKETALLFAIAVALSYILRGRFGAGAAIAGLAAVPYLVWQEILRRMLGHSGVSAAHLSPRLPFSGITGARGIAASIGDLVVIAGPSVVGALILVCGLWATRGSGVKTFVAEATNVASVALMLNVALIWLLPAATYADLWASARTADGLVLAALSHPLFGSTRLRWILVAVWSFSAPLLWLR